MKSTVLSWRLKLAWKKFEKLVTIQYMNVTDGQTHGWTDTAWWHNAALSIATRQKLSGSWEVVQFPTPSEAGLCLTQHMSVSRFLPRDAIQSVAYGMARCPSVTFVCCIETAKHVLKFFSPSCSSIIVVFFSARNIMAKFQQVPFNCDVECRWSMKSRFSQYFASFWKRYN